MDILTVIQYWKMNPFKTLCPAFGIVQTRHIIPMRFNFGVKYLEKVGAECSALKSTNGAGVMRGLLIY